MQPTASSAPAARRSTGTAPAEWLRSQISVAPRSRAAAWSAREVGQRAAAVADVGEHDDVAAPARQRGGLRLAVEQPQLEPALGGDPLEHVAVGREVAAVGHERAAAACVERRADELEQVHRRRVAGDDLARARRRSPAAIRSPVRVGASIQSGQPPTSRSPHSVGQRGEPLAGRDRQPAERVAVEVDPLVARARSARGRRRAGRRRRPPRRPRGSADPRRHRPPERVLRIEVPEVVLAGLDHDVDRRRPPPARPPRSARSSRAARCRRGRRGSAAPARRAAAARPARRPRSARARGPACRRGTGATTPRERPSSDASRRSTTPAWRDDAGHAHARRVARGEPGREVPAGGVPDRHDAGEVELRRVRAPAGRPGGRPPRRRRRACAG